MRQSTVVVCAVLALAVSAAALKQFELEDENSYSFERYVRDFKKSYTPSEYVEHYATFLENIAQIAKHNRHEAAGKTTYRKGVNKFTDMSDAERRAFMGFSLRKKLSEAVDAREMTADDMPAVDVEALPKSVDWRKKTNPSVITPVKDQGGCGSCWAHAATEQVEYAVAVATNTLTPLSRQNLVDCTPNPNQCGGTGGCEGATAELGFAYVANKGMASEASYPYQGTDGTCNESIPKSAKITNWVVLPSNNYTAVVTAVATVAPLAITVAAGTWFDYSSGVFTGCGNDADLDHAVQLVGYGNDQASGMDYWIVRNSWSAGWGEDGYIRIQKHSDGGSQWCNIDTSPGDGTGCQGGPSQVTVCGSCGLWYDVCYATGGSIPSADKPVPAPAPKPKPVRPVFPEIAIE